MKLNINNIGIIQNAEINLNGITVIAGENDSGKSTVGKILYSVMNTLSTLNEEKMKNQSQYILRCLQKVLQHIENDKELFSQIETYIMHSRGLKKIHIDEIQKLIEAKGWSETLEKYFKELYSIYKKEKQELFKRNLFQRNLEADFGSIINNLSGLKKGSLSIFEYDREVLSLGVSSHKVSSIKNFRESFFENVFLIDSPFIIDDFDRLVRNSLLFRAAEVCDKKNLELMHKLKAKASIDIFSRNEYKQKIRHIDQALRVIVGGEFEIDTNGLNYTYKNKSLSANSLAAGLKTFSILRLLLENYWLSSSSLFIFDEPEIHLHPKWQVILAEILVMLAAGLDTKILINTHSPYFLRAVQMYTKKHDFAGAAHYYFARKKSDFGSEILDVTNDLGEVYATLAKPFEDLYEIYDLY